MLIYSLAGFCVGVLVGLTGVGGGSLMTPVLVLLFGIHPVTAVGTDLLYAAVTKSAGTVVHGWKGSVDWRVTGRLLAGSAPATALTLLGIYLLAPGAHFGTIISMILGIALIVTSISLLLRHKVMQYAGRGVDRFGESGTLILTIATGIILGVMVSLTSVGAGALGITALIFLYPKLPTARIVGSDIAHAVPLTLLAGAGHWLIGSVDLGLLGWLVIGSLPGIVIGSYFVTRVPDAVLRFILAVVLMIVGGRLAF